MTEQEAGQKAGQDVGQEVGDGRRERRKAVTRRALEDAALRRFAAEGYDATSVEAIAADAGVSARTFFRYFATKDEVLDMGRAAREGEVRAAVTDAEGAGLDLVRAAVLAFAAGFAEDRDRVVLRERAAASSVLVRGRVLDALVAWEHVLASALAARGQRDADVLAAVGIAVFRSAITTWSSTGGDLVSHVVRGFDVLDAPPG